jgi:hypothetical protein
MASGLNTGPVPLPTVDGDGQQRGDDGALPVQPKAGEGGIDVGDVVVYRGRDDSVALLRVSVLSGRPQTARQTPHISAWCTVVDRAVTRCAS